MAQKQYKNQYNGVANQAYGTKEEEEEEKSGV